MYDASLRSQPDTAIFAYARAYHMTILTFDTDFLNQTAFPPPHAGILVLRSFPRDTSVNELASAVLKAVAQLAHLDISNRIYLLVGLSNYQALLFGFYPRVLLKQIQQVTATQQF